MEHTTESNREGALPVSAMTGTFAFAGAAVMVIAVSIAAYAHALPSWIAPGNADKVFHFAMGGVLAFFLDRALRGRSAWSSRFAPPLSSVLVLVPLGVDEYLQRFSTVRSSSIWDFVADVTGVAVLTLVSRRLSAGARQRVSPGRASRAALRR